VVWGISIEEKNCAITETKFRGFPNFLTIIPPFSRRSQNIITPAPLVLGGSSERQAAAGFT